MDANTTEMNRLIDATTRIVKEHWEDHNTAILLSTLGKRLSDEGINVHDALGKQKLGQFIQFQLADRIQTFPPAKNSSTVRVAPVDAEISPNSATAFELSPSRQKETSLPRFNVSVWLAFKRPLKENHVRHIGLEPHVWFNDVSEHTPFAEDQFAILPDDIIQNGDIQAIGASILAWAKKNEIDLEQLTTSKPRGSVQRHIAGSRKSVFDLLISSLSDHDLARVQMPLDVVVRLFKTRV